MADRDDVREVLAWLEREGIGRDVEGPRSIRKAGNVAAIALVRFLLTSAVGQGRVGDRSPGPAARPTSPGRRRPGGVH